MEQELEKRTEENSRLKGDLQAKNVQLHQIEADVALLKERMIDMKSRIAEAEKRRKPSFTKPSFLTKDSLMKATSGLLLILPILTHLIKQRRKRSRTAPYSGAQSILKRFFNP